MNTEELKQKALAATPGPWEIRIETNPEHVVLSSKEDPFFLGAPICDTRSPIGCVGYDLRTSILRNANAAYIAAANPATILALIAERDEAIAKLDRAQAEIRALELKLLEREGES